MPSVFLSHSSVDKPFVRSLADHLEQEGIEVWLDERNIAPGANIVSEIADGLESDFILLILSPNSVEAAWVKEEWTDAFWEQTNNRRTKLAGVLYRDCRIPRLLRNKKYFDLRTNHPEGFRQIRTWLLNESPVPPPASNVLPSPPPVFIGREAELGELRQILQPGRLAAISGMPGRGKTTLALAFAHRHQSQFEKVYWLSCAQGSLLAAATDVDRQLGLELTGDLPRLLAELNLHCARKRTLLILDNVESNDFGQLIPGGAASVLVTTRQPGLPFLRNHHRLALELFTEEECLALFRTALGHKQVTAHEAECKQLFKRIGYLPLAVNLLASLIRDDVHYTIASVCADLPRDASALIQEAIAALDSGPQQLLAAMAAAAPQRFALSLAASLIDLDETSALEPLHQLTSRSLVEELDRDTRRYRLHALVRETAHDSSFDKRHAEAIYRRFEGWEKNWRECEGDLPDFDLALDWVLKHSSDLPNGFAGELAFRGYAFTRRIGRPAEAYAITQRMVTDARQSNDKDGLQAWLGNQAIILKTWGRLEEAIALHEKTEVLCLELGNKDGLQASYSNQALIFKDWGRLEEALALHKKQEALSLELGNKDGLQASYGNQALILQAWGRLEEALALLQKQEALSVELGYKNGLQASYGNQALILKAWGRLEEALALHKKQKAICLELGNKDGLQAAYGNEALILQDWGRLEEALALYKKQEALCLELGNQSGLAHSYWSQGLLARAQRDLQTERSRLTIALEIFTRLNMPRQRDFVAAELAKTPKPI